MPANSHERKMDRRRFLGALPAAFALAHGLSAKAQSHTQPRFKGVMLMNRIGPSESELFIANADGSAERRFLQASTFDYNAGFSANGQSVVFTSERDGQGQSDLYLANLDGGGLRRLTNHPAVDDAGALSPDGTRVAFVSTRDGWRANIWTLDLRTNQLRNLTGRGPAQGDPEKPDSFFRPAWSPDGQWIAFSSDRNSEWRGHDNGFGWEHVQELSLYVIRADGEGFRRIAAKPGRCYGAPKWSPDGKRVIFYDISPEDTWGARRPELVFKTTSQILSVDVATGDVATHTSGPGVKLFPQFLQGGAIAYMIKGGQDEGLHYTSGRPSVKGAFRAPQWSPDGARVIYQKVKFGTFKDGQKLNSWDPAWDYRYDDVFPALSRDGKTLVITEKAKLSSVVTMNPDGTGRRTVFDTETSGLDLTLLREGLAGAFQPAWSPDGQWIAFGLGQWFQNRRMATAKIMRVRRDGTGVEALTDGAINAGYPSYSADGKQIVYRVWGDKALGLRILDLETRKTRVLTDQLDNLPGWSPDGSRILFTRKVDEENYDVFTIRPDGSDLKRLTTHRANDAHAVWMPDGRILWSSGFYGFRDEAALYDDTFQPYGQIWVMNGDGSGKKMLTDSLWEDSMPLFLPGVTARS